MRYIFPLFLVLSCLLTFLPGCEPKEDLLQTSGSLELQADTVLFDTVFTTIRTVTKRLWVYNRNSGAVKTDISLKGMAGSTYDLVINGDAGPTASGVTIRGKDSLLVLVRAVLGDNGTATAPKQFLVTDEVHFRTNGDDQVAHLVAYGQNAYFHRGDLISVNTTWRTDKPHVIINRNVQSGSQTYPVGVIVLQGITLRIPKGARIYSHAGAYLQVNGTLLVNDLTEPSPFTPTDTVKATNANLVRFQGDRLEPFYAEVPGQWGGIVFMNTSRDNRIRYAEIKNATFGALLNNPDYSAPRRPDLKLENTTIRNISGANLSFANASASSGGGIISYSGDVTATNCLFTNCGEYAVLGVGGGEYNFNFCTFANYTPSFRRETASLTFTNEQASEPNTKRALSLRIYNSIVWGSYEDELFVKNYTDPNYTVGIQNSVLKTLLYANNPAVVGTTGATGNLLTDPLFNSTSLTSSRPDYRLKNNSPATFPRRPPAIDPNRPNPTSDLQNLPRNPLPSIGAYEHKP